MLSSYFRKTLSDLQVIRQNANVIFAVQLDLFQVVFVSQHFTIKIYSLVYLLLAPRGHISAATKRIGVVCFRKWSLCTVVKCSLSTQWCSVSAKWVCRGLCRGLISHAAWEWLHGHSWHLADDLYNWNRDLSRSWWIWRMFMCLNDSTCLWRITFEGKYVKPFCRIKQVVVTW